MDIIKTATLLLQATTTLSAIQRDILPRDEPTITTDPWQCATERIRQYFDVPKPTGSLLTAILSYGDKLYETCTITELPTRTVLPSCPFPDQSLWCAFKTAAPTAVIQDYSSYGSMASAWWAAHSSKAAVVAQRCPNTWYKIMRETPNGDLWLNDTIAFAGCYADEHPITQSFSATGIPTTTMVGGTLATGI